jgi:futalosine hydrolase
MNCLLVAATTKEITPFLTYYRNSDTNTDIDILITGIGLTATSYTLTKQLSMKRPDLVIQAGIAGCFDKNISQGSVVVIKQDTIADLSVIENKELKTMFDLGLMKPNRFPFRNGWLVNPHKEVLKSTKLAVVKAISVNHITTAKPIISLYQQTFQPVIESMEGAALHHVCLMEKIPFVQIRGISNYIGERNKTKWNIKDAVINLNREITRLTENLKHLNFKN